MDGFFEKLVTFLKIDKVAKLHYKASKKKILETFKNLVFFLKKWMGHFHKKNPIFQKIDKGSKFSVDCDWISDIFQHVQKLRFLKQDWVFGKKLEFRWKQLEAANLMQDATELASFL